MFVDRLNVRRVLSAGLAVLAFGCTRADDAAIDSAENSNPRVNPSATAKVDGTAERKTAAADRASARRGAENEAKPSDRFAVPTGGVKELLAFIQETMNAHPATREEVVELRQKALPALKEAAEKIKQIATDEDKKLPGYADVDGLLLYFRTLDAREDSPQEQARLLDEFKAYFRENAEPSKFALSAAQQLASTLERGRDTKQAIRVNRELGTLLAANSDPDVAKWGRKMEGTARRLELPGHAIEIAGTELDGQPFDWSKYRGKVVLVDFWATWCGPCLGELPNVKENYERYHDKGFDVVGISLDSDRQQLEEFVAEEALPWTTLFDGGGWDTRLAEYYGVNAIPRAILVDQEGKVVSTEARGNELKEQLAELLGPPEVPAQTEAKTSDTENADRTPAHDANADDANADDANADDVKADDAKADDVKAD